MREAGYVFDVEALDVEEAFDPGLTCEALTMENARRKAVAGALRHPDALVVGADTLVYVDEHPLSKPSDMNEARAMMRRLSGRVHQVCTGVALARDGGQTVETFATITQVAFKSLDEDAITHYHSRVHVLDKAGGYAIQEHGDLIVESIQGSLSNVIGLPLEDLGKHLDRR